MNYRAHVAELGREVGAHPTWFSKLPRALGDPYGELAAPSWAERLDYEGEVAVVIGSGGRDIAPQDAWNAVAGLTLINDVTMRDFQIRTSQFFAGKTWQGLTPLGPAVVTLDELPDPGEIELRCEVNGSVRQLGALSHLLFDIPALIADLSRIVALEPGDVIATGTPAGVGEGMEPKGYLRDGDVVEVIATGLGALRNRVSLGAA